MVEVPMVGGRAPKLCPRTTLSDILQPRAEELLGSDPRGHPAAGPRQGDAIRHRADGRGGRSSRASWRSPKGIFDGPVRRGIPSGVGGLVDVVSRPEWATATGLLLYGHRYKPGAGGAPRRSSRLTNSVARASFGSFFDAKVDGRKEPRTEGTTHDRVGH